MTERQSKEERNAIAVEAGQRMAVFMEDPLVQRWFERERASLMADMMSDPRDWQNIQGCAFAIRYLDSLKSAMENAVTVAEHTKREIERIKGERNA